MNLKNNLQNHLTHLIRERDPYLATEGHFYVREYIRQELSKYGTVASHQFQFNGHQHENLILNIPTSNLSGKQQNSLILIGAHYDAVPGSPGADDNATGVAVLLELSRLLTSSQKLKYPVRLVAFDLEEYGLVGSKEYAAELKQQQQPLRLMISLEMLGYCDKNIGSQKYPFPLKYFYPNKGNFIALVGNWLTLPDLIGMSRNFRQAEIPCKWLFTGIKGSKVPYTRMSDHSPFWDRGYPAVMITDTAFLRNPHYHKVSDCMETLDLDFLTGVCCGLLQGIYRL